VFEGVVFEGACPIFFSVNRPVLFSPLEFPTALTTINFRIFSPSVRAANSETERRKVQEIQEGAIRVREVEQGTGRKIKYRLITRLPVSWELMASWIGYGSKIEVLPRGYGQ
jgi:hypothetical protein